MSINPIEKNEIVRRTPEIIHLILRQLEVLFETHLLSATKILSSFYNLDDPELFDNPWEEENEVKLQKTKKMINEGDFKISKQRDTRIMCQVVLDFLEDLTQPALSNITVQHLSQLTEQGLNSQEILHTNFDEDDPAKAANILQAKKLKVCKNELVLLARFKVFFGLLAQSKTTSTDILDMAVNRILVAMLGLKQEFYNSFENRSMISDEDINIKPLRQIRGVLALWINDETLVNKHCQVNKQ